MSLVSILVLSLSVLSLGVSVYVLGRIDGFAAGVKHERLIHGTR